VAGEVLQSITETDIEDIRARAISNFISGRSEHAENELEAATALQTQDARIWSDLSAVRYELGRKENDPQRFASALAAAASAVNANPSLPEASFNYALAAEALHLQNAAAAALHRYLMLDSTSEWANEARQTLAALEAPKPTWKQTVAKIEQIGAAREAIADAVSTFPQQTRTWAEGECMARWAEAYLAHRDNDSIHWLSLAHMIGEDLRAKSGESLLQDAVAAIDKGTQSSQVTLANAYISYRRGRILYSQQNAGDAIPLLESAEQMFASGASPMQLLTRYYLANAFTDREENTHALMLLDTVERNLPASYIALRAHILWQRGYVLGRQGRLYESLQASLTSLSLFQHLEESENLARMLTNIAATQATLGRINDAWAYHRESFEAAFTSGSTLAIETTLNAAARDAIRESQVAIARTLLDIELAMPVSSPRLRVDALLQRLKAYDRIGSNSFGTLRSAADAIIDARYREEALDDIRLAEAQFCTDASSATKRLTESIEFRIQNGLMLSAPEAYLHRAKALSRLGRTSEALQDLESAISIIERQREVIKHDDFRDSFTDMARAVYAEHFALLITKHAYRSAFQSLERFRTRPRVPCCQQVTLQIRPLTAEEVAASLPPMTAVLEYSILDDGELVLFAITRSGFHVAVTKPDKAAIAAFTVDASSKADELFEALIAPVGPELRGVKHLIIASDGCLTSIPFAALRDSKTHRYLAEDFTIAFAPNASSLRHFTHQPPPRHVTLVGDPAFDRAIFPNLERLPGAAEEVRRVGQFYTNATVLEGSDASRRSVLRAITSSDLLLLATHAIVNERDYALSLIPLAPDAADSGILYSREIASLNLARSPIALLVGCRTGRESSGHGSLRSLALAFIAAGSRNAFGTLHDVDDTIAEIFSVQLNRRLARGDAPSIALQEVQLMMLRSSDTRLHNPFAWSTFQLYGAD